MKTRPKIVHSHNLVLGAGRRWNWDKIGISLSSLCVAHCIGTPVAFALLPAIGTQFGEHTHEFHWLMAALLLPVALLAFVRGYLHHRELTPLFLGAGGVTVIFAALFLPEQWGGIYGYTYVNIVGSLGLMSGHLLNRRLCNRCDHAH
jgi:hypothetical protein